MAMPKPLILDDASVSIDGVDLECLVNHVELSPDVAIQTLDTLCASTDFPGAVKWALVLTLYQSFDAAATEETLSAAVEGGTPVPFEIIPYKSLPVGATNPSYSGEVIPQPYAPINGDAGTPSTVEIEWSLTGPPTKSILPATAFSAEDEEEAEEYAEAV